jgi:Leucine-rich repeat (LRR) protein
LVNISSTVSIKINLSQNFSDLIELDISFNKIEFTTEGEFNDTTSNLYSLSMDNCFISGINNIPLNQLTNLNVLSISNNNLNIQENATLFSNQPICFIWDFKMRN